GKYGQDLGFDAAAEPGDLDIDRHPLLFGAGLGGFGFGFLVFLFGGLDDLGGEHAHLFEPPDGLVLVGHFQYPLGFLASGVHCHVVEFRHKARRALSRDQVYLTTSSMVVSPSKMLRKPSSRRVTIPNSTAFWRSTTEGARSLIRLRMASLITSNS